MHNRQQQQHCSHFFRPCLFSDSKFGADFLGRKPAPVFDPVCLQPNARYRGDQPSRRRWVDGPWPPVWMSTDVKPVELLIQQLHQSVIKLARVASDVRSSVDYPSFAYILICRSADSLEDSRRWEVLPLRAVSVLVARPAPPRVAHPDAHGRKTVHVRLLWPVVQAEAAAATTHQPLPRPRLRPASATREGRLTKCSLFVVDSW